MEPKAPARGPFCVEVTVSMANFKQLRHKTGETHIVVIHRDGHWHSYLPPMRGLKVHITLEDFQEYFNCSDEDLEIIKLKYGSPKTEVIQPHTRHAGAK